MSVAVRAPKTTGRRALVCGGRDYADEAGLCAVLDAEHALCPIVVVIEGGARGADTLAAAWAMRRKVSHWRFYADWDRFGAGAGPRRNAATIEIGEPDVIIAFPGGRGTANMVSQARAAGVRVIEIGR